MYVDFAKAISRRFSPRRLGPYLTPGHVGLLVGKAEFARTFLPLLPCQFNSTIISHSLTIIAV